ncbi:MAG TPA: fibronectin type III domain-containing protein [Actinomycetota bacterium]|nr:fibronectin type III domain-containing protein [Actinomycetota bacterium]
MGAYKKGIALAVVAGAIAWIPAAGASSAAPDQCVPVPAGVNNQSILGRDIPGIKDVKICVRADAALTGEPRIRHYEGCGDPCFAVVIRDLAVAFEARLGVTYTLGGQVHSEEPLGTTQRIEPLSGTHQCVYSHYDGYFDPCRDGVSTPADLEGLGRKTKVTLGWDKSFAFGESYVVGYEISRSTTGEEGSFTVVGSTSDLTFDDTSLRRATEYWYTVTAIDNHGNRSGSATPISVSTR